MPIGSSASRSRADTARKAFTWLVALAVATVCLQALWAGIFIREHQDYPHFWIVVHARGADVAIALAALSCVVALTGLRRHRRLALASGAFTLVLVAEAYLGGLVGPTPWVEELHFPLALILMGLGTWLLLTAIRLGKSD